MTSRERPSGIMVGYEMADNMADTMSRRDYGTGSVFQKHDHATCPPRDPDTGDRPKHACKGRWMATVDDGFTATGGRRRVTVTGKTKKAVQQKLRDKRVELDKDGRAAQRTVTLAKWAATWLEAIQPNVRPSAYETDKAAVRWIVSTIGHVHLSDLSPGHVRSLRKAIVDDGKSTSTALRYHGSLVRMLKAAALEGYKVPPNALLTEAPKKAVHDREAMPLAATLAILEHLTRRVDGVPAMPDSSRWTLAFLQGIRQAEALGLTWDQVGDDSLTISWQAKSLRYRDRNDPSKGFLMPDGYEARHIIGSTHLVRPKSKAGWRVIPLVPWATTALRDWREIAPDNPHGLVWPGRTTKAGTWPRNAASDRESWEAIQSAVGVSHPSGRPYLVHEIRNTTATLLMELKVPESVRIAIMGHSSITTTHGYEHADISQMRSALDQVSDRLRLG